MKVYVVCGYDHHGGYSEPIGVWKDEEHALEAAHRLMEDSDNGYDIVEVFGAELGVFGETVTAGRVM